MNRKDAIDKVVEYIKDESAQYAILINGNWGCGKTHLYKNYLVSAINSIELGKSNRKDNVYISLYGISTIEDLSRELLLRFISVKTSKGTGDNKDIVMNTAGILGIISKSVTFSVKNLSVGSLDKVYEKILNLIKSKNMVICLDDLERCALAMNEVFGWINNLTEHCNCKVIILADEGNIGKMYANVNLEEKYLSILSGRRIADEDINNRGLFLSPNRQAIPSKELGGSIKEISVEKLKYLNEKVYSENFIYKDIKEKVIGETIYYSPSVEDTVNDLLRINEEDSNDHPYKKFLRSASNLIKHEFNNQPSGVNYRTVKLWIKKFKKIYDECASIYSNDDYFFKMLEMFLKSSIASVYECKANITLKHTSEGNNAYVQYGDFGSKILTFGFVDSWIRSSSWQKSSFKYACDEARRRIAIEEHHSVNENKNLQGKSLKMVNDWRYKSDQEVEKIIIDMISELKNGEYAFYYFPRILGDIIYLSRKGFCDNDKVKEVTSIMKEQIEKSDKYCQVSPVPQIFDNAEDKEEFERFFSLITECAKEHNRKYRKIEAVNHRAFLNASEFDNYCTNFYDTFYENKSFLGFVGKAEILDLIAKSDLEDKYIIASTIERVYSAFSIKEYFSEDLELITQLLTDLDDNEVFGGGKTDKYCKDYFIKVLSAVKDKLQ